MAIFGGGRSAPSKYKIVREVARGGMSSVYEGIRKADKAQVAIKIITPEFTQLAEQLEKIFRKDSEGQIAIGLRHPNVVRTYEYGTMGREYYIIMEYIDGPNLKQLIDKREARWSENRLSIALQVGRGLAFIHKNDLVHRDFCPKNILLDVDDSAKVIDFGLAIPGQMRQEWRWDRSGTAAYMAPEQVRGQKVDVRTDVYAYGVTTYEILTGQRPYPDDRDRNKKMAAHLNVQPVSPRHHNRNIPVALEHIILKSMAKNPDDRYESVEAMLRDMATVVSTFFGSNPKLPVS